MSHARLGASLSDQELMDAVAAGDVDAFGRLYDRFHRRAYRIAHAVCRDEGRAEDAVQDAFVSVWRNRASYDRHRGTVAGWLLTAVRHRALDLARSNGRHAALWASADRLGGHRTPEDISATVSERDSARRLRAVLAMLPDEQQEVITLAYYGQLTHAEIATQLRLPSGTVKSRMRLGLHKLRAGIITPPPARRARGR
ncbi:MAG TPA: sigma-70 family RNA polymerase sigma factor [Solirubrobacteraceae bacterium]|nr:sigma-70 family RNA polymerase sigma factor [Solirubrobacteraceae bacterium]